jgi:hypothetical protein
MNLPNEAHPVATVSQESTAEPAYVIELYCSVSITLNGFAVPVPEDG